MLIQSSNITFIFKSILHNAESGQTVLSNTQSGYEQSMVPLIILITDKSNTN